jgi:anthranilate phosphoribosyltransferase
VQRALVFHAADGMDELSVTGPSRVIEVVDGGGSEYVLDPQSLGLPRAQLDAMRGGAPAENAAIARDVLTGKQGSQRDVVLLNAAAALRAAGRAEDWKEGMGLAAEAIDSGRAAQTLERWAKVSQSVAPVTA